MKFRIDLKILFFLVLFFFTKQLKIYLIIMGFATLHEFMHLIVGKILNFKIQEIQLMPLGLSLKMQPNFDDYKKKFLKTNIIDIKYFFVAIAGPLFNLICIIIFGNIGNQILMYSNLIILILNSIPIYPLDGGRALKSILRIFIGADKTENIINYIMNVLIIICTIFGSVLMLYLNNIAILLILIYLWDLVIKENKRYKLRKKVFIARK